MHPAALPGDGELVRDRFRVGEFAATICTDGSYLLDGGAMFGVVPKTLWGKRMAADAENRILLGLNTLVVRTGKHVVVVETGIGNKQTAKMREILGNQERLPASLRAAGVDPREVDAVVNTHLHFDHCGWNTTMLEDGRVGATFPNARYFVHRGEVEHGRLQLDRDAVSYVAANYEPLLASGQMVMLDPAEAEMEIVPGISVEVFPGHTEQMMVVHVQSGGERVCFVGDLIPTTHHLQPTWVMGYDLHPVRCIAERKRFLARAVAEGWLVVFPHDHHVPAAYLHWDEKGRAVARRRV